MALAPGSERAMGFTYHKPPDLEAAVELLAEDGAMVLSGGTDLVAMRAAGMVAPSFLVDVKQLTDLGGFSLLPDGLRIGALTTMERIGELHGMGYSALVDGAAVVGAPQTRSRATLGGNVCRSSPAGDTLPALLVLEASLELHSTRPTRSVPLANFFTGPGTNVRRSDELLTSIQLPRITGGSAYERLTYRRWMDLAVVGIAARVELEDGVCTAAWLAAGGVAPTPLLIEEAASLLASTDVGQDAIERACEAVAQASHPIDDVRGSREYRLHVLRPLARRVLIRALERARSARKSPEEGEG